MSKKFAQNMVDFSKNTIDEMTAEDKAKAISVSAKIRKIMMEAGTSGMAALGLVYWEVSLAIYNIEEQEQSKLN